MTQQLSMAFRAGFQWKQFSGRFQPAPPKLPEQYTQQDYLRFMREEVYRYCPRYAREKVVIDNGAVLSSMAGSGAVLAFIHYGSFFLSGGSLVHQLGLRYTAIATSRNLIPELVSEEDIYYWRFVHRKAGMLYQHRLLHSDENPRVPLRWLQQGGLLGIALDVREYGQRSEESLFDFLGRKIYLRTSVARIAKLAKVPMIPMSIQYDPVKQSHRVQFGEPLEKVECPVAATQTMLDGLADDPAQCPEQWFHHLSTFEKPDTGTVI